MQEVQEEEEKRKLEWGETEEKETRRKKNLFPPRRGTHKLKL